MTSAGNVGIGTTNPAYTLDVNGNQRVSSFIEFTPFTTFANETAIKIPNNRTIQGQSSSGTYFNAYYPCANDNTTYFNSGSGGCVFRDNSSRTKMTYFNGTAQTSVTIRAGNAEGSYMTDWPAEWGGGLATYPQRPPQR